MRYLILLFLIISPSIAFACDDEYIMRDIRDTQESIKWQLETDSLIRDMQND